jgi:RNA recognition motif-containing protein
VLYLVNVPYDCSEMELQEWIESCGIRTRSIRLIRDLVTGASPAFAYVELEDSTRTPEAVAMLDGRTLRTRTLQVKQARVRTAAAHHPSSRRAS